MAVIKRRDKAATLAIDRLGKGEALEDVIHQYQQCRHTTQAVEQFVVGLGVGKIHRLWG